MTELKPSMILRYYTGENDMHYTAIVLKNDKILSVKVAGQKDKTIYRSLIHWLSTLPGTVTVSDLDIQERQYKVNNNKKENTKKSYTLTLKDIAPNYDLFRFLITYEAYSLKNSLISLKGSLNRGETMTYVMDIEENLHPVKYNRRLKKLYSEYHNKIGSTLEEIGFHKNANIYVKVNDKINNKNYTKWSFAKAKFPFTHENYESFYNAKFAFVISPRYNNENYYYTLVTNFVKEKGYYIYTKFLEKIPEHSIFYSPRYKYLEANIIVIKSTYSDVCVISYNPNGIMRIPRQLSNEVMFEELKNIIK